MARQITLDQHPIWEGLASERLSPPNNPLTDAAIVYPIRTEYRSIDTKDVHYKISDTEWIPTQSGGAGHVLSNVTGEFISKTELTLSATSQALPTPPVGAANVVIQIQGGTTTDVAYISLDGTDADSTDYVLRNIQDVAVEPFVYGGTLEDIRILGTAGASTAVIWWFK